MVRFPMSSAAVYERVTSLGNSECCPKTVFCHYGVTIVSIFAETVFAAKRVYKSVKIFRKVIGLAHHFGMGQKS